MKDMKAPISTALSMGAILATGGAALAVNASVLSPQTESAPPVTDSSTATAPASSVAEPGVVPNEFQIPGVGLVTMATVNGVLTLDGVVANSGFSYTVTETSPGVFDITFESSDQVVTFTARVVDGQIVTSATGRSTQPPATQPASPAAPAASGTSSGGSTSSGATGSGSSGGGGSVNGDHDDDHDFEFDDDGFEFEGGDDD